MKLRLIGLDYPDDPHMNLAMDEAIFLEVMKGNSPPTFRFYRNSNAVILGCFQLADEEVDIKYAIRNDIKIAKRFTGGGAVYH
ncbi:MAG: lipoate--protein ligase family protein, partial [Candidatus Micrarchaeaceae archaeon]